jgi:hypothetical protein
MNQVPLWVPVATLVIGALMPLLTMWVNSRGTRAGEEIHRDRSRQELEREMRQADAGLAARQGRFYEALVLMPLREYLQEFDRETRIVLQANLPRLRVAAAGSHEDMNAAKKQIQIELGETWAQLKRPLDFAVDSFSDSVLMSNGLRIHEELADDVGSIVRTWAESSSKVDLTEDAFRPAFAKYASALLRVTRERDPELRFREELGATLQSLPAGGTLPSTSFSPLRGVMQALGRRRKPPEASQETRALPPKSGSTPAIPPKSS